ncbi:bifunctional D-glycero-beta-D-manno-heptose-7-phosphate kinase/D-glycero-beta-D-manno-heptose 1-phosphate adenylyltransferase HldE [Plasticicumulans sp.]|uniref:bifunctional D-glycero-beta-D-manno-heptose-7-phosphate kinase/D-glycero-beta-D-manno-heptose 1-phosphate adenylyltransferase HldE n=1 Tax=Plasticicumulans sp. TaxID=2307179 RepID=UPI0039627637
MPMRLPDFSRARVLVAGDLMLDRYWSGPARRISPEAPVPVVHVSELDDRPGGAGNVALNVAALGGRAWVCAPVGADEAAGVLRARLEAAGVGCAFEVVPQAATITKLRVLARHQQLIRLDFEDGFPDFEPARLAAGVTALLDAAGIVVCSDYAKGALRDVAAVIAAARAAGRPVLVDPKGTDYARYAGALLITPNEAEFAAVAGEWADEAGLVAKARRLAADCGIGHVLITRSERGMTLVAADGAPAQHIPTRAREVFDVTGAGDTVIATLAAALAAGSPLADAVQLANHAAGIAVGKLGTATVTPLELAAALAPARPPAAGVVERTALLEELAAARARGERIVMTNGCFDLLHAGHVRYLAEAAALGDRLIVAVNDDASVRRLKGSERPIHPLAARMEVLAALRAVDWVLPFTEDTPRALIAQLLPDVLVKGGDYRPEDIAGGAEVIAAGGEVIVLGFVEGHSTTATVGRIRGAG